MQKSIILLMLIFFSCAIDRNLRYSQPDYSRGSRFTNSEYFSGVCSYYGKKFHGRLTANGEIFDMYALTAAHNSLQFGTIIEVENLDNNKKVTVRINDQRPFVKDRVLDLSYAAAKKIDLIKTGTTNFRAYIISKP